MSALYDILILRCVADLYARRFTGPSLHAARYDLDRTASGWTSERLCWYQHGVPINHEAQQVSPEDFKRFTHILASDEANLRALERMKPTDATAEVRLWGSYADNKAIADPYYGGMVRYALGMQRVQSLIPIFQNGFEQVYRQCVQYSNAFLDEVVGKKSSNL